MVPKSRGIIGVCKEVAEGDFLHHLLTRDQGRGRGGSSQHTGHGGIMSKTMDRPMATAPTQAYTLKACEDQDAPEVIAGIFSLYDIEMHALIDLGSTHSYV